jgi:hypothetical protein
MTIMTAHTKAETKGDTIQKVATIKNPIKSTANVVLVRSREASAVCGIG